MTAPFLVSASPLSLLCRGRLLVCSISSLFSRRATTRLMNSLPLSEWKPRMRKGNCRNMAFQYGFQLGVADALGGGHDLPLRDLIHRVDVVDTLAGGRIALVHGVDPQVAGPALRIGTAALADGHRRRPRPGVAETAFAIAWLLAQVIEMRH